MRASVLALLVMTSSAWAQTEAGGARPTSRSSSESPAEWSAAAGAPSPPAAPASTPPARAEAPASLTMVGVFREFAGGHPDLRARRAPGRHAGIVGDRLDLNGRPVFVSRGYRVLRPARDASGEPVIGPRRYIEPQRGDQAPRVAFAEGEAVDSARTFDTWFRDVEGVNQPSVRRVNLRPGPDGAHEAEVELGSAGTRPATLELRGRFVYHQGADARLRFTSADHLWVFIDGRLVVDLGGTGAASGESPADAAAPSPVAGEAAPTATQTVQLDRLPWLADGAECEVRVFCAAGAAGSPVRIEAAGWPGSAPASAVAEVEPAAVAND